MGVPLISLRFLVGCVFLIGLAPLTGLTSDYSNTLVLTDQKDHYNLSRYLDIYEDKSGKLTIDKIVKEGLSRLADGMTVKPIIK